VSTAIIRTHPPLPRIIITVDIISIILYRCRPIHTVEIVADPIRSMAVAGVVATNMPKLMLAPEARSQVPPVA
jgi:hypothetical protein